MRKYDFENLTTLDGISLLYPDLSSDRFELISPNGPTFAPLPPGPLFATINGTTDDDTLTGTSCNDVLRGFEGDDTLIGGSGADQLNGGVGFDIADYSSAASMVGLSLLTGGTLGDANGDTFFGIEGVIGSGFDDDITGNNSANLIMGGAGDDIIDGGAGTDTVVYMAENVTDYVFTETATGIYSVEGPSALGEGIDTLTNVETIRLGGLNGADYDISYFISGAGTELTAADDAYQASEGETVYAAGGNDNLRHDSGADNITLFGQAGDDNIASYSGDNILLDGGAGDDMMRVNGGDNVRAYGGEGNDIITFYPGVSALTATVDGGSGVDTFVYHTSGIDPWTYEYDANTHGGTLNFMTGEAGGAYWGADFSNFERLDFYGGGTTDYIVGGDYDDIIHDGGSYAYFVYFNPYDSYYEAIEYPDTLIGGGGNDQLIGTGGSDTFYGGEGDDIISSAWSPYGDRETAVYESVNAADYIITIQMARGGQNERYDVYNVEAVGGTGEGTDTLTAINTLRLGGLDGTDYGIASLLTGAVNLTEIDDDYTGTSTGDVVNGGLGDDYLRGLGGDDVLNGGNGDDIFEGGTGADRMDGGYGTDTVTYENAANGVLINTATDVAAGAAAGDVYYSIEIFTGTNFDDTITSGYWRATLHGLEGDDVLNVRSGLLDGGAGDDTLIGNYDAVAIYASQSVKDYIVTETAPSEYTVQAVGGTGEGTDMLSGGIRTLRLGGLDGADFNLAYLANTPRIDLTNNIDDYTATAADEIINGLEGNDIIRGESGDDILFGDAGDDVLIGGDGIDVFYGGAGNDDFTADSSDTIFYGGAGIDDLTLSFSNVLNDFETLTIDVRDKVLDGVETLNYVWDGPATTVYGLIQINASQMNQITNLYNWFLNTNIYFDGTEVLDLSNLTLAVTIESYINIEGTIADETVIIGDVFGDVEVRFTGDKGSDTFIIQATSYENLSFSIDEKYWDEGIDHLDISQLPTIMNDHNGNTGLFTFDLSADRVYLTNTTSADQTFIAGDIEAASGWDGDDIFISGNSNYYFNGNGGMDTAVYSSANIADYIVTEIAPGEYTVEAIGGTNEGTDTLTGIEFIRLGGVDGTDYDITTLAAEGTVINLTNGDDAYTATDDEVVNGLDGNDTLTAEGSNITLNGDGGADVLFDQFTANASNILNGGAGADNIYLEGAGSTANGGLGDDNIFITNEGSFANGDAGNDIISATLVFGTSTSMTLSGGDGTDTLVFRFDEANIDDTEFYDFINSFGGTIDLSTGTSGGDYTLNLSGFERLDFIGGGRSDNIVGGAGDDIIQDGGTYRFEGEEAQSGIGNNDTIYGMAGDDIIIGTGGIDILDGGDGNDTITSGEDIETVFRDINFQFSVGIRASEAVMNGGAGDDIINSYGDDVLEGGEGDDILVNHEDGAVAVYASTSSADYIVAETAPGEYTVEAVGGTGEGTDKLIGIETIRLGGINGTDYAIGDLVNNVNTINGTAVGEILNGTQGDDIINGLGGDDIIRGYDGNDILNGGTGNDSLIPFEGDDTIDGGEGVDKLVFFNQDVSEYEIVQISSTEYMVNVVGYGSNFVSHVEILSMGGAGSNGFTAALANFDISFLAYYDTINVNLTSAADSYMGTGGIDAINGLAGDDILFGFGGDDIIFGGSGDDIINGGEGADVLIGREGFDTLSYEGAASGVIINLRTGTVGGAAFEDQIFDFENIIGTDFADNLVGTYFQNIITGGGGDDIINGSQNTFSRPDIAVYASSDASDYIVTLIAGGYTIQAIGGTGEGTDTLTGIETIRLGGVNGTDYDIATLAAEGTVINLTNGDDDYTGTSDDEIIYGLDGNDIIRGDRGDDIIYGGAGNDTLNGGLGLDNLYGGDGDDVLLYANSGETFHGGAGNDEIRLVTSEFDVNDAVVIGGDGLDLLWISGSDFGSYNQTGGSFNFLTQEATGAYADINFSEFETLYFYGGGFTDTVFGSNGDDYINGGSTWEYFDNDTSESFYYYDQDFLYGMGGDDTIISRGGANTLDGGDGNDTLMGGQAGDILRGGAGDDILFGNSVDTYSTGSDTYEGGGGIDTAVFLASDPSNFTLIQVEANVYTRGNTTFTDIEFIRFGGMDGTDYDISTFAQNTCDVVLTSGHDTYTETTDFFEVCALDGNDTVIADGYQITIHGGDGNDTLSEAGLNGENTLNGDAGNDTLYIQWAGSAANGGAGEDSIFLVLDGRIANGGDGDDVITIQPDSEYTIMELDGGAGIDTLIWDGALIEGGDNAYGGTFNITTGTTGGNYSNITLTGFERLVMDGGGLSDTITGGSGDDDIYGGGSFFGATESFESDDFLYGMGGNDLLHGGGANDLLDGGDGDDVLVGGANFTNYPNDDDTIIGGAGIDTAVYSSSDVTDYIITETAPGEYTVEAVGGTNEGFDTLTGVEMIRLGGLNGTDYDISTLAGGETFLTTGDDVYSGTADDEVINALDGDDVFDGGTGNNTLNGDAGDDTLISLGNDILNGGTGNDTIEMGGNIFDAATATDGGADIDTISFSTLAQLPSGNLFLVVDLNGQAYSVRDGGTVLYVDSFLNFENATGSEYRDLLQGDAGVNILMGLGGDDTLQGRAGADTLNGGTGDNTLDGGDGNDLIISEGNDIIDGGAGDDIIEIGNSVFEASTLIDGGTGLDTLSFETLPINASITQFIVVDLQSQSFSVRENGAIIHSEAFFGFENVTGSDVRDLLQGDAGANQLFGLDGDDTLQGRGGDDYLHGWAGDDILQGGAGADLLNGGSGFDTAVYSDASSAITYDGLGLISAAGEIANDTLLFIEAIIGTDFNDRLFGANDASVFYGGEGADRLFGRNGDDELYGGGGDDIILAGRDNDLIDGGAGDDQLRGNEGDDTIFGGDGNDSITGGAGADAMDGGAGIDRVEYTYGTNAGVTASLGNSAINTGDAAGDTYVNIENLYGTSFADTLYGDAGNNRIDGRSGDDVLFGGDGNDYMIGGAGDDVLNGEAGNDLFLGQAGADIYQFDAAHGIDRIVVFTQGEDMIEFTESVFDFSGLTLTQDGAHVNIDSAEGRVIVNNSLVADFTDVDFIYATPPAQEPMDIGTDDIFAQDPTDLVAMDFDVLI